MKINFSVLTATTAQNKVFSLDNGKLKKSSSVNPFAGNFKAVSIDSLDQFASGLTRLNAKQSLVLGTIKGLSAGESIGLCVKGKESAKQISKTLDFISYTDAAGFMLVDIDQAGHYTDFLNLFPEIKSAVIKPSSSSFIYDSNGNEVIGAKGWHIFIPVANQSEITAIAEILWQRQWLSGHGHYLLSAGVNPAMLERGLFDKAVFSPERLIFEAKPTLNSGLIQNAPAPLVMGAIEQSLKLSDFSPYSKDDLLKIESLKAVAKESIRPAQTIAIKQAKKAYIANSGLPARIALTNYKQIQKGILTHDFEVITQKYGKVKIADLLANPDKFNNCTLADPFDPDYDGGSKTKARFYWNNGVNPIINSQAHGGIVYRFAVKTEPEKSVISDNTESATNTLACLLSYIPTLEKSVIHAIKDKNKHCKTCHKAFTPKRVHHNQCPRCFIADSKQTKPQYNWIDHSQHDVSYVNQRYLNVPPTEGKVNIYISTQGTGKTYGAVNFVKSLPAMSVLYIAHLVTLVFQAARKFGIECYSDHKKINEHERLAVCINSIFKLIDTMGRFLIYDTVVLDEIEQQLTRMIGTGKDAIKNKPLVLSVLCHLIKNAKTLVCLDADISPITFNLVQRLRPNERFNVIINEWQDTEITHYIYENETDIINLTRAAIAKNEPALLMTNGLNKSIELDNLIECDNKIVINSKTSKLAAVKEFVNDVNEQCKKYLLGIFSPTVNTGFSIESGHFKWDFGIFKAGINTPLDWFQQLLRDRITKDKHVYIEDKKTSYHAPRYDVAHDFNMMVCNGYGDLVYNDPIYAQLVADVRARDAALMCDPKAAYVRIAKERGHKVIFVKDTATAEQITIHKEAQKTIKVERELLRVDSICTIEEPISSYEEYQEALKEPRPTPELLLKIEHFEIRDVYASAIEKSVIAICETDPTCNRATVEQEVFRQFVIDDDGCKRRKQIENLRLATSTYNEARELQLKKATGKFKEDVDYIFPKYLLLTQLFKAVGINPDLTLSKEVYTSDDLKEFFEWVEDERELIASFWAAMPTKEAIEANPYRYIRTLLDTVGIGQARAVKFINKKTQCIGYKINQADLETLHFFLLIKETPESVIYQEAA